MKVSIEMHAIMLQKYLKTDGQRLGISWYVWNLRQVYIN
uniref:Uncharacterized protein n=1 Tax=Anguilla anguilla TaxID=7936 RepID=A0A0E9UTT9_ANGAN